MSQGGKPRYRMTASFTRPLFLHIIIYYRPSVVAVFFHILPQ